MTEWLHAVAGGLDVLLSVERVRHVAADPPPAAGGAGPGHDFPLVDLAALVGGAQAPELARERVVITYGDADARAAPGLVALTVDEVHGVVTLPRRAILTLPPLSAAFAAVFDAIAAQPVGGGRHPLCVRADLDPAGLALLAADRRRGSSRAS